MVYKAKKDYSMYLMAAAIIVLLFCSYLVAQRKWRFKEVSSLPFYNTNLETVEDGVYHNRTETSFLHLELEVTVENHKIVKIDVLDNDGIDGEKARPILDKMIAENKVVVSGIKGADLGSVQYISCVDCALHGGAKKE